MVGYFIALVAITFAYFTIVQPQLKDDIKQYTFVPNLFHKIYEQDDVESLSEYVKKEWDLSSQIDQLTLSIGDGHDNENWFDVIVDYEEVSQGKVILYETPTTLARIDISEHVPLIDVHLNGDLITVTGRDFIEESFLAIKNEMVLRQFLNDSDSNMFDYFDFHEGEQVLLLTLPNHTKVHADEHYFQIYYKK